MQKIWCSGLQRGSDNCQTWLCLKGFEETHQQNHRIDTEPEAEVSFNVQHGHDLEKPGQKKRLWKWKEK